MSSTKSGMIRPSGGPLTVELGAERVDYPHRRRDGKGANRDIVLHPEVTQWVVPGVARPAQCLWSTGHGIFGK